MNKIKKIRLDEYLVKFGLIESRSKAKAIILAGKVMNGSKKLEKPGQLILENIDIKVKDSPKFVSRGGIKLDEFLSFFDIKIKDLRILDIGASTGGFTDCCLQRGASHVTCLDVGRAQLHNKLIQDNRVINIEKYNARDINKKDLPFESYPRIVIDLSFISLKKVLPQIWKCLESNGVLIMLVKPQFEAKKTEVDEGKGIIKDDAIHQRVLNEIIDFSKLNLYKSELNGILESPIKGAEGNKEFLVGLTKMPTTTN